MILFDGVQFDTEISSHNFQNRTRNLSLTNVLDPRPDQLVVVSIWLLFCFLLLATKLRPVCVLVENSFIYFFVGHDFTLIFSKMQSVRLVLFVLKINFKIVTVGNDATSLAKHCCIAMTHVSHSHPLPRPQEKYHHLKL